MIESPSSSETTSIVSETAAVWLVMLPLVKVVWSVWSSSGFLSPGLWRCCFLDLGAALSDDSASCSDHTLLDFRGVRISLLDCRNFLSIFGFVTDWRECAGIPATCVVLEGDLPVCTMVFWSLIFMLGIEGMFSFRLGSFCKEGTMGVEGLRLSAWLSTRCRFAGLSAFTSRGFSFSFRRSWGDFVGSAALPIRPFGVPNNAFNDFGRRCDSCIAVGLAVLTRPG